MQHLYSSKIRQTNVLKNLTIYSIQVLVRFARIDDLNYMFQKLSYIAPNFLKFSLATLLLWLIFLFSLQIQRNESEKS